MLVFSAIAPHSPLLIETIGKDNTPKLKQTIAALKKLSMEFYVAKPDSVIILTPHANSPERAFLLNFSPKFIGRLKEFGDFSTKEEYYGDNALSYRIKERLETKIDIQLTTIEKLDYGSLIPLHFITAPRKEIKIVPLSACGKNSNDHCALGEELSEHIHLEKKRIAVIASAELSHKLSKKSPDGYSPSAKKFDQEIISLLKAGDYEAIKSFDERKIDRVGAYDFNTLAIFLGLMSERNCIAETLSYEGPFGVGYLVMNFAI